MLGGGGAWRTTRGEEDQPKERPRVRTQKRTFKQRGGKFIVWGVTAAVYHLKERGKKRASFSQQKGKNLQLKQRKATEGIIVAKKTTGARRSRRGRGVSKSLF